MPSHATLSRALYADMFGPTKGDRMRLDIPAGTAVRFEPGQTRSVNLVALAGERKVYGFRQAVMGKI